MYEFGICRILEWITHIFLNNQKNKVNMTKKSSNYVPIVKTTKRVSKLAYLIHYSISENAKLPNI